MFSTRWNGRRRQAAEAVADCRRLFERCCVWPTMTSAAASFSALLGRTHRAVRNSSGPFSPTSTLASWNATSRRCSGHCRTCRGRKSSGASTSCSVQRLTQLPAPTRYVWSPIENRGSGHGRPQRSPGSRLMSFLLGGLVPRCLISRQRLAIRISGQHKNLSVSQETTACHIRSFLCWVRWRLPSWLP